MITTMTRNQCSNQRWKRHYNNSSRCLQPRIGTTDWCNDQGWRRCCDNSSRCLQPRIGTIDYNFTPQSPRFASDLGTFSQIPCKEFSKLKLPICLLLFRNLGRVPIIAQATTTATTSTTAMTTFLFFLRWEKIRINNRLITSFWTVSTWQFFFLQLRHQ